MTTLDELMESTYFALNSRIRDEKTRHQYRVAMRNFREAIGHEPKLADLTDDNVTRLVILLSVRKLAAKTINERRGRINAMWAWLARRGTVTTWPTVPPIPEPERVPVAWTREQLNQLFHAADRERLLIAGIPAPLWWRSLHFAAWDSGERITALISCCWPHLQGEWLHVPAELRKGKRRDRIYRLATDTLACLDSIRTPPRERIWPWPYSPSYLWIRYRIIRQRAGLPTDRRSAFHRIRRSVASYYEQAGGNATELLGHSSRHITRSYLDPTIVQFAQPADLLFRPQ